MRCLGATVIVAAAAFAGPASPTHGDERPPLRLERTIPLPNVEGRIDHLAVDLKPRKSASFKDDADNVRGEVSRPKCGSTAWSEPPCPNLLRLSGFCGQGGRGFLNIIRRNPPYPWRRRAAAMNRPASAVSTL